MKIESESNNLIKKTEEISLRKRKNFMNNILKIQILNKINDEYLYADSEIEIPSFIQKQYKESVNMFLQNKNT